MQLIKIDLCSKPGQTIFIYYVLRLQSFIPDTFNPEFILIQRYWRGIPNMIANVLFMFRNNNMNDLLSCVNIFWYQNNMDSLKTQLMASIILSQNELMPHRQYKFGTIQGSGMCSVTSPFCFLCGSHGKIREKAGNYSQYHKLQACIIC